MSKFIINGGKKLEGEIRLSGAKNAATKMMVASLLTAEPCAFSNFPDIGDTEITAELCRSIGSQISVSKNDEAATLFIHTPKITNAQVLSLTRRNRIPILALGPLLSRVGEAVVPMLGGDKIGPRPVDIHLNGLRAMGAIIEVKDNTYVAKAPNGLVGAKVVLRYPSVGATENTILAACLARGRTSIHNAAVEPEILDLIKMLQQMGAIIELGANRNIYIDGVNKLHGVNYEVMPDRNEAVSFACLAIATNGRILVREARQDDLITFLNTLRRIGGEYEVTKDGIIFYRQTNRELSAISIETDTHPGFMTDWQQPVAILLTKSVGESTIHETVYEDRFGYANDLIAMGAEISVSSACLGENKCHFAGAGFKHSAVIKGPRELRGAKLEVRDLRAGIAHVIAALSAAGTSVINGIEELDRGYVNLDKRLRGLGVEITRI